MQSSLWKKGTDFSGAALFASPPHLPSELARTPPGGKSLCERGSLEVTRGKGFAVRPTQHRCVVGVGG